MAQFPGSDLRLEPYGSYVSGCYSKSSDLDLALTGSIALQGRTVTLVRTTVSNCHSTKHNKRDDKGFSSQLH